MISMHNCLTSIWKDIGGAGKKPEGLVNQPRKGAEGVKTLTPLFLPSDLIIASLTLDLPPVTHTSLIG